MQKITIKEASLMLDCSNSHLHNDKTLKKLLKKDGEATYIVKADLENYISNKEAEKELRFKMTSFLEFLFLKLGEEKTYSAFSYNRRDSIRRNIKEKALVSLVDANDIKTVYDQGWGIRYEKDIEDRANGVYVPLEKRKVSDGYIRWNYWHLKRTVADMAEELNYPEHWLWETIKKRGLTKKANLVKFRGRKGYVMPKEERKKHQRQPHSKKVSQICPVTFRIVKTYRSQKAPEEEGFCRENVRKALKTGGLHKGYLWAYEGLEEATIRVAKKRGKLDMKLRVLKYKKPSKEELKNLYIEQNLTLKEIGSILGCDKVTVAILAKKYDLKKRKSPITKDQLIELRVGRRLSVEEIADITGRTVSTIRTYLSRYKIRKPKKDQKAATNHFQTCNKVAA